MKSSWAYHNGGRELNRVNAASKAPATGWLAAPKKEGIFYYAERNKHNHKQLVVKTYANKAQANKMIEKLKSEGIDCSLREKYPFVIECKE